MKIIVNMKFIIFIVVVFFFFVILVVLFVDGEIDVFIFKDRDISVDDSNGVGIFSRVVQNCKIIGDFVIVNCCFGVSISFDVVYMVRKGDMYKFICVKIGECVIIGGKINW